MLRLGASFLAALLAFLAAATVASGRIVVAGQAKVTLTSEFRAASGRAYVIVAILLVEPFAFAIAGLEPLAQSLILLVGVVYEWYVAVIALSGVGWFASATFGFSVLSGVGFRLATTAAA